MKKLLLFCFLLVEGYCCYAQELQILRPDSSVFTTILPYDFITARLGGRGEVSGQLMEISNYTITVAIRKETQVINIEEIEGLKKTSKFGIASRRLSNYSFIVPILFTPSWNSDFYEGRTVAHKAWTHAAIIIPTTLGLGLLMQGRPLRKTKKGYSFKVKEY